MGNRVRIGLVVAATALVASSSPSAAASLPAGTISDTVGELAAPLGQSARLANQTDESPGVPSPVVFQDGFESLALWGGRSPSSRNKVELTPAGYDGAGLRVRIPRGSHFGADFKLDLNKTLGEDPENLFFRYYLRLDPDWAPTSAGKLPGFSGVYGSTGLGGYPSRPSNPGWSSRMAFFPSRNGDPRATIGYYVYHLDQKERYGDSMRWNQAGKLVPGNWYCLEGEVRLNSLGQADGRLRGWVDGTPAFHATGLEFRRPTEPKIRIESFWFNVYYGGKSVPSSDLGLTIDSVAVGSDRVGCGAGSDGRPSVEGDLDGDGLDDQLTWRSCPGGPCFRLRTTRASMRRTGAQVGDDAWFSLQTHRFGLASGDLDGDGRDELVYRGRCDGSTTCWRVHDFTGSTLGGGEDWGGGARFASSAATLVVGDWDGDGREDIAYEGRCDGADSGCWTVHRSKGDSFAAAEDWGALLAESLRPIAADIDGDGLDDLVYTAACGEKTCWYGQTSQGSQFSEATRLGRARQLEFADSHFVDFDGDGLADLITVRSQDTTSLIEARLMGDGGLAPPIEAAAVEGTAAEVQVRRAGAHGPTEAVVRLECGKRALCVHHLATWSMNLVPVTEYRQLRIRSAQQPVE